MIGSVYLLHFSAPIGIPGRHSQARHYLGWAGDLAARLKEHQSGRGAAITRAALERGIVFECVRVWPHADRGWERALKQRKNAPAICPACGGSHALRRACGPAVAQLELPLEEWSSPPGEYDWWRPDGYQLMMERRWREMRATLCNERNCHEVDVEASYGI